MFVLAAAGLLDSKRVTTHWRHAERLVARFPRIIVEPLYIDEGQVLTSAGSAAGIALCLHLVRNDFGAAVANYVAKGLVAPPHRDGGQMQYVSMPVPDHAEHRFGRLVEWTQASLHRNLTIDALAKQASMSARIFARHFRADIGTTPHQWLTHQRLIAAQRWLETTNASIEPIAEFVGTQTPATLRHHFRRKFRTSPAAYRKRFATMARGPPWNLPVPSPVT